MEKMESMTDFFAARAEGYDEHMLFYVPGCREGYRQIAQVLPEGTERILDLGCGTGLELKGIFERFPGCRVTGVDLSGAMLEKLKAKYPDKPVELICGDYFSVDFGKNIYDCAVSFQTMHHFSREKKIALYRKIYESLTPEGCYAECDYMVETQQEEDFWFAENRRLREKMGIEPEAFYHFDTPCTVSNQIEMLMQAGFARVRQVFREENTTLLFAVKKKEKKR